MFKKTSKSALAAIPVGLLALSLAACGGVTKNDSAPKQTTGAIPTASSASLVSAAKKEGEVVWYSSNTRPNADLLKGMFEKKYPDIKVKLFQAGGSQVISKVEAEIVAGHIKADFVDYSEGSVAIDQASRGLLERFAPEHIGDLSADLKDPDGYFFSPYFLSASIVYNSKTVSAADAPKSWKDLTDKKWKGKVGMASPDYAGTAVGTIAAWDQQFGDGYIKKLGGNGMKVLQGFGDVHNAVLSGQTPVAVNLSFRAIQAGVDGQPMTYVNPAEGQVRLPSAAAVVAKSAHPNAAKLFANFQLSDEAQIALAKAYFFPARIELAAQVKGLPDLTGAKFIQADPKKLASPTYVAQVKQAFKNATS